MSHCSKARTCPGSPPLLTGCGAGAELAWCTPPHCHLRWLRPPQDSVGGGDSPWLPGWAARSCQGSSAHQCHAVPAHGHWRSLAASALSRSKATPCPHGGEGQEGPGAGGITAKGTAGHSQLGTRTQMVLPESCSSDQQVMGQEKKIAERRTVQMTEKSPCSRSARKKGKRTPEIHPETLAKLSTMLAHWFSLGRR